MACVRDDAASKTKELEDEVNRLKEKLCSADEQERMVTDIIEQKLELEETIENLKAENTQSKELSEEKSSIAAKLEQFKVEKETEIENLTVELTRLQQLRLETQNREDDANGKASLFDEVSQEKCAVEEQFNAFRQEKEHQITKLMEDIEVLQSKVNGLQEKENETIRQKSELDNFKMAKESEVQKLNERMKELEVHLQEKTNMVEEKDNFLNEIIQLKCEAEEKLKVYGQEKDKEIEKLMQQLEKSEALKDGYDKSLDPTEEDKQVMLLTAKVVK